MAIVSIYTGPIGDAMKPGTVKEYVTIIFGLTATVAAGKQILEPSASRWWIILFCVFAAGFGVLVVEAVLTHLRKSTEIAPIPEPEKHSAPLTITDVRIEDARNNPAHADLKWPLKAWITLRNDSDGLLYVGPADWIANSQQAQLQLDPVEGIGWKFNVDGQSESRKVTVAAGGTFKVWWGLSLGYAAGEIHRKRTSRELGMLVIQAAHDGINEEARFAL